MTNTDYILSCAGLPFDLGSNDDEGQTLLNACPAEYWHSFNSARNHEMEVRAGDMIAEWIAHNWRTVLPVISARFPLAA